MEVEVNKEMHEDNWSSHIDRCFGESDGIFSEHDSETKEAIKMLTMALEEGVSFSVYKKEIAEWLTGRIPDTNPDKNSEVMKQMDLVCDLESYFLRD